jgi:hypothetical protein
MRKVGQEYNCVVTWVLDGQKLDLRLKVLATDPPQKHGWINNEDEKQPLKRPGTMWRKSQQKNKIII